MTDRKVYLDVPEFTGENVPITVAARVMKKSKQYVRQGILQGRLSFGVAVKNEGSTTYDYYISPKKFWEETGFVYRSDRPDQTQKETEGMQQKSSRS